MPRCTCKHIAELEAEVERLKAVASRAESVLRESQERERSLTSTTRPWSLGASVPTEHLLARAAVECEVMRRVRYILHGGRLAESVDNITSAAEAAGSE